MTIEEALKLAEGGERFCDGLDIGHGHTVVGPSRILAIAAALREMCARVKELERKGGISCGTCRNCHPIMLSAEVDNLPRAREGRCSLGWGVHGFDWSCASWRAKP